MWPPSQRQAPCKHKRSNHTRLKNSKKMSTCLNNYKTSKIWQKCFFNTATNLNIATSSTLCLNKTDLCPFACLWIFFRLYIVGYNALVGCCVLLGCCSMWFFLLQACIWQDLELQVGLAWRKVTALHCCHVQMSGDSYSWTSKLSTACFTDDVSFARKKVWKLWVAACSNLVVNI